MNVFPGRLDDGALRAGPFVFTPAPENGALRGREIEVGVRPEHVHVTKSRGTRAEVQVLEVAGSETFLHLVADGDALIARVPSHRRPETGETVRVSADVGHAYFFDAATGERPGVERAAKDRAARVRDHARALRARDHGPDRPPRPDHVRSRAHRVRPDPVAEVHRPRQLPGAVERRHLPYLDAELADVHPLRGSACACSVRSPSRCCSGSAFAASRATGPRGICRPSFRTSPTRCSGSGSSIRCTGR